MEDSKANEMKPTPEELVAISDYLTFGDTGEYSTPELKAAGQRVRNYMEVLDDNPEAEVPDWVSKAIKVGSWATHDVSIQATKNDIGF